MSNVIIAKVQNYLSNLSSGRYTKVDFTQTGRFSEAAARSLKRQLMPDTPREWGLRMSSVGRPGCVLEAEKFGLPREPEPYSSRFRNLYGDLVEASAVACMKQAGVNIVSEQEGCSINIAGVNISGTLDLIIAEPEPKLYDIKSASGYSYRSKFLDKTLKDIKDTGDAFGYCVQLYLYSTAMKIPVGGLIVVNKETGEWTLVPPPVDDEGLRLWALEFAQKNTIRLTSNKPFTKDFQPVEEWFRKKPTGNLILHTNCSFCSYKKTCWPEAQELPQVVSSGANPRKYWYTKIDEKYLTKKEENGKE